MMAEDFLTVSALDLRFRSLKAVFREAEDGVVVLSL